MLGVHRRFHLSGNVSDVRPGRYDRSHQMAVFGLQFVPVLEHLLRGLSRQLVEAVPCVFHFPDLLGALELDQKDDGVDVVAVQAFHHGYRAVQHAVKVGLGDGSHGGYRYAFVAGTPSAVFEDEAFGKFAV